jgi:hypothetical protein
MLADRMSHTEPDVPSIHTPLAHENTIATDHTIDHTTPHRVSARSDRSILQNARPATDISRSTMLLAATTPSTETTRNQPTSERQPHPRL